MIKVSINSELLNGFNSLPTEVYAKIISHMDLQTLFNIAHSSKNGHKMANKAAKLMLENKFVVLKNKSESYLKQLFDYLLKSRNTISNIFQSHSEKPLSDLKSIESNLKELAEKTKLNPKLIDDKADSILKSIYPSDKAGSEKEIELKLLIEKGAKVNLLNCLSRNCSQSTIQQILYQKAFNDTIDIGHLENVHNYPETIIIAIESLIGDNIKLQFGYSGSIAFDLVNSSTIPESAKLDFISKLARHDIRMTNALLDVDSYRKNKDWEMPESISKAILGKADFSCKLDPDTLNSNIEMLTKYIWAKAVKEKTYSFDTLIKLIELYTKANIQFNLERYEDDILYQDHKFYKNDQLIRSLTNNKAKFSLKFLNMTVRNKVLPELVCKIYENTKSPEQGCEPSRDIKIRADALTYMFNSKSYKTIYDLNELGEYPGWEAVQNAISEERGENLINLLLDAYEKEESRKDRICGYHYTAYSHFLASAVEHKLSESLINRILDKSTSVFDYTLKKAKKHHLSEELIQKMQVKIQNNSQIGATT